MNRQEILLSKSDYFLYVEVPNEETEERLERYCLRAQLRYLKPLLCTKTYNTLVTGWKNQTLTSDYQSLLAEVKPYLVARTAALYFQESDLQATLAGLKKLTGGDFVESPTGNEIQLIVSGITQEAEGYERSLINYLDTNEDTFTDWKESTCNKKRHGMTFNVSAIGKKRKKYLKYPYNDGRCIDC